ncbi:hypothetical protein AK812_SmicGene7050 [Symbiodinium microadriaticum]|uniref:Uncharacterized protein n=1 Tax=Symbiodinium microadriaticum TaxID=2951 RepID=A0A1Q9EPK7_SYMMI|nr:hypothetical protein AK812_SmicGene7050 [Symbiodinium microadriaticum]
MQTCGTTSGCLSPGPRGSCIKRKVLVDDEGVLRNADSKAPEGWLRKSDRTQGRGTPASPKAKVKAASKPTAKAANAPSATVPEGLLAPKAAPTPYVQATDRTNVTSIESVDNTSMAAVTSAPLGATTGGGFFSTMKVAEAGWLEGAGDTSPGAPYRPSLRRRYPTSSGSVSLSDCPRIVVEAELDEMAGDALEEEGVPLRLVYGLRMLLPPDPATWVAGVSMQSLASINDILPTAVIHLARPCSFNSFAVCALGREGSMRSLARFLSLGVLLRWAVGEDVADYKKAAEEFLKENKKREGRGTIF